MLIESPQNEKIKYLTRILSDNRFRKKEGVFAVEGKQENDRALKFGYQPSEFYIAEQIYKGKLPAAKTHLVSEKIYEKIAYRGTSEGIIGLYQTPSNFLSDFKPGDQSAVMVVESVEKPGNLGAILRSCEAFGIDALIITDSRVDFYNPNVIRSSVGCLFGMNIYQSENEELETFLHRNNYTIFTTLMSEDSEPLQNCNLKNRCALVFGTEHSGLSNFWKDKGHNTIIPMAGSIDSLNLSNAVAICAYEILRQKMA